MRLSSLLVCCYFFCISLPADAQVVPYSIAQSPWNADSLGNHRALVRVQQAGQLARVIIPWRRSDLHPEMKRIIVQDAQDGQLIKNVYVKASTREKGDIIFQSVPAHSGYNIYYLPYKNEGRSNYPRGVYLPPATIAEENWLTKARTSSLRPNAVCTGLQSVDSFNSFFPMEVIATAAETSALQKKNAGKAFLVFPEDRLHPASMKNDLPFRWIQKGPSNQFAGTPGVGENYSFQLCLYALRSLDHVSCHFSRFANAKGDTLPASFLSCLNTGGNGYNNRPVSNDINVPAGTVQPLWFLVKLPEQARGNYKGVITVQSGSNSQNIAVSLGAGPRVVNAGVDEPWKMTRLAWLNSDLAQANEVIPPYTALHLSAGNSIQLLGRRFDINTDGLPRQIQTYFTEEMTSIDTVAHPLFTEPVHFHFTRARDGKDMKFRNGNIQITRNEPGTIAWNVTNTNDTIEMAIHASIEFDGFVSYEVRVRALEEVDMKEITLHLPFKKEASTYLMGLGQKGGIRPDSIGWKWDPEHKNQDGAWIGAVNAGLQYSLRDQNYVRPLNTNFYLQKPLHLPSSWGNNGKGGISVAQKGPSILANNYSGPRLLKKGDTLYYNFNLLITPFHPLNTGFQWSNRFYHRYASVDSIRLKGATVVNIHHATPVNPWINYPFIEWRKMKSYTDSAHQQGLKVKIYNTVRELSDHAWETQALRSLGHEVYATGKGGGFSWLQEHLGDDYIAAWFVPEIKDAAIINSGMNRWHNYYVEGMNWLVDHTGIDGIYLDDVAFDRITMKRIKRVLTKDGHPGIIDLHSANQYNKNDGFNNSAMLYMEHFPYLNRLWFGEYFDYEHNDPSFFLTEVSGIPFGLMGEMLEGDGNPWRGMVYGMTSRLGWSAGSDPRPIWKFWDDAGIAQTKMMGYWSSHCPVTTNQPMVKATVFQKPGMAIVALASWADSSAAVKLQIDWKALGLDPDKVTLTAPDIRNFQQARTFSTGEEIVVEKARGWLLLLKEK